MQKNYNKLSDDFFKLSRGQKEYLKEQQISEGDFQKMGAEQRGEWVDETRNPHYEHMRKFNKRRKYF